MQLTLFSWPPVASHMVAILLGVTLSNISDPDPLTIPLPDNSWVLTLSRKVLSRSQNGWFAEQKDLMLTWTKGQCRLTNYKVKLISKSPQIILKIHSKDVANLLALKIRLEEISLAHLHDKTRTKICQKNPQVLFGR